MVIFKKFAETRKISHTCKFWITTALALILVLVPITYCVPLIGLGLENPSMIEHFTEEDVMFLEFHGQYEKGPFFYPGFRHMNVYPKIYYNTAGLFLYPYAYFFGDNDKVILVTWRLISMFSAAISGIILFAISKKLFDSNTIAFIGTLCFLTIPQFLIWSTQVRPNPLEQTLILGTIFMCIKLAEKYSFKRFFIASLLGGLAFSTKYGGWIFIFVIPIVTTYSIAKSSTVLHEWDDVVQRTRIHFLKLSPLIMSVFFAILGILVWLLLSESFDVVRIILTLSQPAFAHSQLIQAPVYLETYRYLLEAMTIASLTILSLSLLALIYLWIKLYRSRDAKIKKLRPNKYSYTVLCIWFGLQTITAYVVIFFVSGPVYLAHPSHLVSQVGFMFFNTALGGSYGPSGIDSYLIVVTQLFNQMNPAWLLLALLIPLSVYRQLRNRKYTQDKRATIITLWSYAAITILLIVVLRAGSIRHALPGLAILSILITYPIFPNISSINTRTIFNKTSLLPALSLLLISIFIIYNIGDSYDNWKYFKDKDSDTGLIISSWISDNYPNTTTILTDQWNFYIPPEYQRLTSTSEIERDASSTHEATLMIKNHINETSPHLIVVTHPDQYENTVNLIPILSSVKTSNGAKYKVIKTFDYKHPEKQRYQYTKVIIYENPS